MLSEQEMKAALQQYIDAFNAKDAAAMAFDFEYEMDGHTVRASTIDVMEFNGDGKIERMRAYWGPSDSTGTWG